MLRDFIRTMKLSMKSEDAFTKFLEPFPYALDLSNYDIAAVLIGEFENATRSLIRVMTSEQAVVRSIRCLRLSGSLHSELSVAFDTRMQGFYQSALYKSIEKGYPDLLDYLFSIGVSFPSYFNPWQSYGTFSIPVAKVLLKYSSGVEVFFNSSLPDHVLGRLEFLRDAGFDFCRLNKPPKSEDSVLPYLTSSTEVCELAQSLGVAVFQKNVCHISPSVLKYKDLVKYVRQFVPYGLDVDSKDNRNRGVLLKYVRSNYNASPDAFALNILKFRIVGVKLKLRSKILDKWLARDTVHPNARANKVVYGQWRSETRLIELALGLKARDLPVNVVLAIYEQTEIRPEYLIPPIKAWEICKKIKHTPAISCMLSDD